MIIRLTPLFLWLAGFTLILCGAARFGWHTAAIVGGGILLKCSAKISSELAKGWKA